MGRLIVFDVNETLLSLEPIRRDLEVLFGPDPPIGEWFARLLHGSLLANALDDYRPFDEIGADVLVDMAERRGLHLSAGEAALALSAMTNLPAYPDVVPGLERLAEAGFAMVALTNGSSAVANAQIENAGLGRLLERVISVQEVGRFKPDPTAYRHAAVVMESPFESMTLAAAHDWDCAGALAAGASAVFVARPGARWSLPTPPPSIVVPDMVKLAEAFGA